MRSTAIFFSWAMRDASTASRAAISASSIERVARDFQGPNALLLLDARHGHHFVRRDVAFLQRPRAFDFERPGGELGGDTLGGKRLFAGDAGGFGDFRGGDLFFVDRPIAPDLTAAGFPLRGRCARR